MAEYNGQTILENQTPDIGVIYTEYDDTAFIDAINIEDSAVKQELQEGIELCTQAVKEDKFGNYRNAFNHYKDGIFKLLSALKTKKVPGNVSEKIRNKCSQLLTRASYLKKWIDDEQHASERSQQSNFPIAARPAASLNRTSTNNSSLKYDSVTTFDDVAGLENAKDFMKEYIMIPLRFPELFRRGRYPQGRSALLFGVPGVGKTLFSKVLCNTKEWGLFGCNVSCYRLSMYGLNKYREDSEHIIRDLFLTALSTQPSIVIIDDLECLSEPNETESEVPRRLRTELLLGIDSIHRTDNSSEYCWVICLCQEPWKLNRSFKRRLSKRLYLELPDHNARMKIFKSYLEDVDHKLTDTDFEELAIRTQSFSGSDIVCAVREATFQPLRSLQAATHFQKVYSKDEENKYEYKQCNEDDPGAECINILDIQPEHLFVPAVTMSDCITVLARSQPSVTREEVQKYESYAFEFTDWIPSELDKKELQTLQSSCCKTIAKALLSVRQPDSIEKVLTVHLPLPKRLKLMVLKHYATYVHIN